MVRVLRSFCGITTAYTILQPPQSPSITMYTDHTFDLQSPLFLEYYFLSPQNFNNNKISILKINPFFIFLLFIFCFTIFRNVLKIIGHSVDGIQLIVHNA